VFKTNRLYMATMMGMLSVSSTTVQAELPTSYKPSRINLSVPPHVNIQGLTITDLNNNGSFVGRAKLPLHPTWPVNAFYWETPAQAALLPFAPPSNPSMHPKTEVFDLGDNGMIIGQYTDSSVRGRKEPYIWDTNVTPISYSLFAPDGAYGVTISQMNNNGQYLGKVAGDPAILENGVYTPAGLSGFFFGGLVSKFNNNASIIVSQERFDLGGVYQPYGGSPTFFKEDEPIGSPSPTGFYTVMPSGINDNEIVIGRLTRYTGTSISGSSCYYTDMNDRANSLELDGSIHHSTYNACTMADINNENVAAINLFRGTDKSQVAMLYDVDNDTSVELTSIMDFTNSGLSFSDFLNVKII
jgi:hypothetical protein